VLRPLLGALTDADPSRRAAAVRHVLHNGRPYLWLLADRLAEEIHSPSAGVRLQASLSLTEIGPPAIPPQPAGRSHS
jgi:hypothetical protein